MANRTTSFDQVATLESGSDHLWLEAGKFLKIREFCETFRFT